MPTQVLIFQLEINRRIILCYTICTETMEACGNSSLTLRDKIRFVDVRCIVPCARTYSKSQLVRLMTTQMHAFHDRISSSRTVHCDNWGKLTRAGPSYKRWTPRQQHRRTERRQITAYAAERSPSSHEGSVTQPTLIGLS